MALPAELRERLHERHVLTQRQLVDLTARRVALELGRLPNLSPEAEQAYVAAAVPLIAAGQRRSATVAAAYARAVAPDVDPRAALELQLDDVVVTADTAWVASPIIRARAELAGGAAWAAALAVAASKARGYVSGDLAVAQRHGLERGARSTGRDVRYRKAVVGDACAWCRAVASTLYALPSNVPFHERDGCGVEPVYD